MTAGDSPDVISHTTNPYCTRVAQSMDSLYTGFGVIPLTVPPSHEMDRPEISKVSALAINHRIQTAMAMCSGSFTPCCSYAWAARSLALY